jgi:hypothetical protein
MQWVPRSRSGTIKASQLIRRRAGDRGLQALGASAERQTLVCPIDDSVAGIVFAKGYASADRSAFVSSLPTRTMGH